MYSLFRKKFSDDQSIKSCAEKYIVAEEHVVNAVRHIYENTVAANLRKKERAKQTRQKKEKKFGDYDWKKLVEERKLDTLTVYELDKYLKAHNICITKRNKLEKIKLIIAHHESGKSALSQTPVESNTDDSSGSTNSDYSDIDELHSQDSSSHSESSSDSEWSVLVIKTADIKHNG